MVRIGAGRGVKIGDGEAEIWNNRLIRELSYRVFFLNGRKADHRRITTAIVIVRNSNSTLLSKFILNCIFIILYIIYILYI